MESFLNRILQGHATDVLKQLPDSSIDLCFTSPPYFNLRIYTKDPQELGREHLANDFVIKLADVFDAVYPKLKDTGSLFVTLGDSYNGSKQGASNGRADQGSTIGRLKQGQLDASVKIDKRKQPGLEEKALVGIPHLFWVEMVYGLLSGKRHNWIPRNDIPWIKIKNWMRETAVDKWVSAHEYIFFFVKQKTGYFHEKQYESNIESKNILQDITNWDYKDRGPVFFGGINKHAGYGDTKYSGKQYRSHTVEKSGFGVHGAPDYWLVMPQARSDNHFAAFPDELPRRAILAACPEYICNNCGFMRKKEYEVITVDTRPGINTGNGKSGSPEDPNADFHNSDASKKRQKKIRRPTGELTKCSCNAGWRPGIVLDPFCGRGTTCIVARQLGRDFIGIDLDSNACRLAMDNLAPLLAQETLMEHLK